jgi:protein TonB
MNLERTGVHASAPGSWNGCLVEGDPERERRARRGKFRAVLVSIAAQVLSLAALIVFPLLSKGERSTFERTPLPPYPRLGSHEHRPTSGAHPIGLHPACRCFVQNTALRPVVTRDLRRPSSTNEPPDTSPNIGEPTSIPDGNPFAPANNGPKPVVEDGGKDPHKPARVSVGHIEPALLVHRVEPTFPRLGITLRHETHVELHAIISTDGSIQSLEVLSGDPLFYLSSLDAVRQWRYRPTYLNGQPVEVDTHITIIYTLNH